MSGARHRVWKRLVVPLVITIVAAGTILGYAYASGQLGIVSGGPGKQSPILLALINYTIGSDQNQPNPTVATIWLRNLGTSSGTITTLLIQDTSDNGTILYSSHPNQTIGSGGAAGEVVVDTLGSGFYFSHGGYYFFTISCNTGFQMGFHLSY